MSYLRNAFEYLESAASRWPEKTAFYDDVRSYTFSELYEYSKTAANGILSEIGTPSDGRRFVCVLVKRNAESLLSMFSVLCSGYAYVPVDDSSPAERVLDIISQTSAAALVYQEKTKADIRAAGSLCPCLCMKELLTRECPEDLSGASRYSVIDTDPAYAIFTSGSTGKPKGIAISHRALIDFTEWMAGLCDLDENDRLANQAPFYFDLSVKDIYQTLRKGCTTYIIAKKYFSFPKLLVEKLNETGTTAIIWAASAFRMTADSGIFGIMAPETLRYAVLGGEALRARHVNIWKKACPGLEVINLYGPTEVTVDCTYYRLDREFGDTEQIPIGKACENKSVVLLNERMERCGEGEIGEICVRGSGLALGYVNDPERTSESFIQNPLNSLYPDRLYRTGDLGKAEDGNIYFVSRKDDQIKHAGYRIELGEIESSLQRIDGVRASCCVFDDVKDEIICFIQSDLDTGDIADRLSQILPRYMIPGLWKKVGAFPLNANGKIDRKLLKEQHADETGR